MKQTQQLSCTSHEQLTTAQDEKKNQSFRANKATSVLFSEWYCVLVLIYSMVIAKNTELRQLMY